MLVVGARPQLGSRGADDLRGAVDDGVRLRPGRRPRARSQRRPPRSRDAATATAGRLVLAAGVVWFAQDLEGWSGGPAVVRSLGAAAVPLLVVPPALLVAQRDPVAPLRLGRGRRRGRRRSRRPSCARSSATRCSTPTAGATALAFARRPRRAGLARTLDHVWLGTTVALGVVVLVAVAVRVVVSRGRRRGGCSRRSLAPAALAAAPRPRTRWRCSAGRSRSRESAELLRALLRAGGRVRGARRRAPPGRGAAARQRAAVSRLADELGAVPERARARLRRPDGGGGATGFRQPGGTSTARAATSIRRRRGRPRRDADRPRRQPGRGRRARRRGSTGRSSARSARPPGSRSRTSGCRPRCSPSSTTLRASRARIVETGDAERRRLERDLHDGAQQRLLALSYDLRLARAAAAGDGDDAARDDAGGGDRRGAGGARRAARARARHLPGRSSPRPASRPRSRRSPTRRRFRSSSATRRTSGYDAPVETAAYCGRARRSTTRPRERDATCGRRVSVDGRARSSRCEDDGAARAVDARPPRRPRRRARRRARRSGRDSLRAEIPCA